MGICMQVPNTTHTDKPGMRSQGINLGVDGQSAQAKFHTRANDTPSNFSSVGHQDQGICIHCIMK